jgi:hypothetical protein
MQRGTTHVNTGVTSEPADGFPNWHGWCECGWKSVPHQRKSLAEAEVTQHNVSASRTRRTPEDKR